MSKTKIEWADETWNPIVGCSKISEGCRNCYAENMAFRIRNIAFARGNIELATCYDRVLSGCAWNSRTALNKKALEKKFPGKGKRIFVGSMGDMFHESVFFTDIDKVLKVIQKNPQHIFMFLTKRPEKMKGYFKAFHSVWPDVVPNLWIGATAENQEQADLRIPQLLQIPAAKRFVSVEPMLGPVNLSYYLSGLTADPTEIGSFLNLDWVICGGESGNNARPLHPEWAGSLRDQCKAAKVPFFFKQWGEWWPGSQGGDSFLKGNEQTTWQCICGKTAIPLEDDTPCDCKDYYDQEWHYQHKTGKKKAGRLLDKKEYSEVPK